MEENGLNQSKAMDVIEATGELKEEVLSKLQKN